MEQHIFTTKLFYEYINTRNLSIKNHKGYFIQERNKFFVSIDSQFYESFKKRLINRRAVIIAESKKTINKQLKTERNYIFIDCINTYCKKSIKALFKRYNLTLRKKRVLNANFRQQWKN